MALTPVDFHSLIDDHAPALYRLAYRLVGDGHDAEDIVQETLRSAWTSRMRFDGARLSGGSSARAWLAAILRRRVVDRWRRVGRTPQIVGDGVDSIAAPPVDPLAEEYTDEMQLALQQLTPELREALLLVVVGGLTHQETADLIGAPLGTILSRVSRARRRLRENFLAAAQN